MKPEDQIIAIAEFCGYEEGPSRPCYIPDYKGEMVRQWYVPVDPKRPNDRRLLTPNLPQYLTRRDCMGEALGKLNIKQSTEFLRCLARNLLDNESFNIGENPYMAFCLVNSHPSHQAHAMLESLGLWKVRTTWEASGAGGRRCKNCGKGLLNHKDQRYCSV